VFDHRYGTVLLIAAALNDGVDDSSTLWSDAQARLDDMQVALSRPSEAWLAEVDLTIAPTPIPRTTPDAYAAAIEKSKQYIRDGDVFQVVVSQRFDHEISAEPLDVYRVLRTLNPSPYMYLLTLVDPAGEPYSIVGSSPEALVKVSQSRVYMHPIAGSRPRGETPERDLDLAEELLADDKEKSEHLMLVDLARNDIGRVCRYGSIRVPEYMVIERYSHVMHIVSQVEGDIAPDKNAYDLMRATFPAGTVSGAPKIRAMQIIAEKEPSQRGFYAGALGYFGYDGNMDTCIMLRTALLKGGRIHIQAGAGIVADSVPESEYQETINKASALFKAVAMAEEF